MSQRGADILVVDDEPGLREFLSDSLELAGHRVATADSAERALALVAQRRFDLVMTDLSMPGQGGMALVRALGARAGSPALVVLTAHGTVEVAVEAMRHGAVDFIQKPVASPDALCDRIGAILRRRGGGGPSGPGAPTLGYGDPAMRPVEEAVAKVARTDATVLILGESGTGKEVCARAIHAASRRAAAPLMAVNCAALAATLLESELFGHEKGAFTGATERRAGKLAAAEGGTFFLDEVGELEAGLQAKLLRVLQERTYEAVGSTRTVSADVRWVAATNRDLPAMMARGTFREDLYHRLAVFPIHLPPLRARPADIVPMARAMLGSIADEVGRAGLRLSAAAERVLAARSWPGNARELRNVLARAAILAEGDEIDATHVAELGAPSAPAVPLDSAPGALVDLERAAIAQALASVGGNRRRAAELLGIAERTLYDKIRKFGL
jgi:two-component system response regulator AtoC